MLSFCSFHNKGVLGSPGKRVAISCSTSTKTFPCPTWIFVLLASSSSGHLELVFVRVGRVCLLGSLGDYFLQKSAGAQVDDSKHPPPRGLGAIPFKGRHRTSSDVNKPGRFTAYDKRRHGAERTSNYIYELIWRARDEF